MSFKLYDALGLSKGASKDDIKKAFRRLAVQHHPDKGGDPEKFKEIAQAYEVLNDDAKRQEYDQYGDEGMNAMNNGGHPGFTHMDPRHIFEQFFGGGGMFGHDPFGGHAPRHVRRNDVVHQMRISLQDAFHGCVKNVKIGIHKTCFRCKEMCHACQGQGNITEMRRMGFFTQMLTRPCDACHGTGAISKGRENCPDCKGRATYQEDKRVEIIIPMGIHNGHNIQLEGLGEQPKMEGESPGDLILQIVVMEDPHFQRNGHDLLHTVQLSLAESIIGKKITIPHFGGSFDINTAEYGVVQPAKPYCIPDKGMPINAGKQYGQLQLQFSIQYPTSKWSEQQKELLQDVFQKVGLLV